MFWVQTTGQLSASGDLNSNSNSNATITWDVTASAAAGLPADVSGSASISLGGGGGGSVNDELSLVAKDKAGDYDAGNGWKASVDLGWGGGSNGSSSYNLELAGTFSTDAEGNIDTNMTQDEFSMNANAGSNGNDWLNSEYDGKSKSVSDTTVGGWTYHSENESTSHEGGSATSNGGSSFNFGLSKPTGGAPSGSFSLTFDGGSSDEWHVNNESNGEWEHAYSDAYSSDIRKGESTSTYTLDDVYGSSYGGNPSATLSTDGSVSGSGSTQAEETYTFDQVSLSGNKWSDETSYTGGYEGYTFSQQDKWEYEYNVKTTDHYEAEMSENAGSGSTSSTLSGSDTGYTETEWFNKSCHTWNNNGTPGGPDCSESTWTNHEDWPSYVDEYLAMMESEAEMAEEAEDGAVGSGAMAYTANEETDETGGGGEEGDGDGIIPAPWPNAQPLDLIDIYGYDVGPVWATDGFGLPVGLGRWNPGSFFAYSGITPDDTRYGCGGLMCMRVGLQPNYPQQLAQVEGAMAFPTLEAAQKYLAEELNGEGLIVAAETTNPVGSRSGVPLEGDFMHPASDVDFLGAFNYRALLGTPTNWYWEEGSAPWRSGGRIIHSRRGFSKAAVFIVIPNAASQSPVIPIVP